MTRWSLSSWVAGMAAGTVAAAMASYAAWEHVMAPTGTLADLVLEHAWHVLALGSLVYVVTSVAVRRWVATPIRVVGAHLYGVGTGVVEPLDHDTPLKEIATLVSSVNLMIQRMRQGQDEDAVDAAQEDLVALRRMVREIHALDPHHADRVLAHLTRLQSAMAAMIRRAA